MSKKELVLTMAMALAGLVVLMVIGCETETTGPKELEDDFVNPYDWAGEMHNRALTYARQKVSEDPSREWTVEDAWDMTQEYFESIGNEQMLLGAQRVSGQFLYIASISTRGRKAYFAYLDSLCTVGAISERFETYAKAILNVGVQGDQQELNRLAREIQVSDFEPEAEAILLSAVSVAKHSSGYWSQRHPVDGVLCAIPPIAAIDIIGGTLGAYLSWRSGNSATEIIIDGCLGAAGASTCGWLGQFLR